MKPQAQTAGLCAAPDGAFCSLCVSPGCSVFDLRPSRARSNIMKGRSASRRQRTGHRAQRGSSAMEAKPSLEAREHDGIHVMRVSDGSPEGRDAQCAARCAARERGRADGAATPQINDLRQPPRFLLDQRQQRLPMMLLHGIEVRRRQHRSASAPQAARRLCPKVTPQSHNSSPRSSRSCSPLLNQSSDRCRNRLHGA